MLKDIKIGCASSKTKYGTRLDTSIVKLEKEAIWSGLFTSNKFKSAPVEICLEKINKNISEPKVLMVNAGNANAATGKKGKIDSEKLIEDVSSSLNVSRDNILPFSTGVVGELLDTKKLTQAFKKCTNQLGKNSWEDFANAIMTTDTRHKVVKKEFKLGKGRLKSFDWKESNEIKNNQKDYPLILTTSRVLQHYNAATMTRRTNNINIVDEDVLLIHPKDAADRDLNTGDIGRLYSGRGEVALKVEVTDKVKEGIVFTTFHFPEHMVNMVTGHGKDEETMCAEYKVSSVQVQKISNQFKTEVKPKEHQAEVS